ncbi:MAG: hypothetical protein RIQ94_157 [Pseudomonadota bacterium]|jgi:hypothetical protein
MNKRFERHGMCKSNIYSVWENMISRCHNKNRKDHINYGGRGIYVCDEWRYSFIIFFNDIDGINHDKSLQIDRIDNDGPYCKENFRWVSGAINRANKRSTGKHLKGAKVVKNSDKYYSTITIESSQYYIGLFSTELIAHNAFMLVHKEWYGF